MFRIWGKIFKDNHLLQDMVYENNDPDLNRTTNSAWHLTCKSPSGWRKILRNSSVLTKPVFIRIILLSKSNLTIWKFMSLKKIKH